MRNLIVLFHLIFFALSNHANAADLQMFAFKEIDKENYLIVHYNSEVMHFEECFRHTPCRFFGEIRVEKLDKLLSELYATHSSITSDRATIITTVGIGAFLGLMLGEAALFIDRDPILSGTKVFITTTIAPTLCALLPMVMHEKARAYNTALMLEDKLYSCERTSEEVKLDKVRTAIDELIELLN